ncbi:MAG: hypothetical protein GY920_04235 [Aliivibrio sp.]|jgi:hypothetical protein|nr:hypothetical protein [Aliivibrio sp.]
MAKSRTQRYYDANPDANKRRLKQQTRYQKTKKGKQLKRNAYLGSLKIGSVGDGKDVSHTKNGVVLASPKANRSKKGIHA